MGDEDGIDGVWDRAMAKAMAEDALVRLGPLQALALSQVLDMALKGLPNCYGITPTQALRNCGYLGPRQRATPKVKRAVLAQLRAQGVGVGVDDGTER